MERYQFVEEASVGHNPAGNPWLQFTVRDCSTGDRIGLTIIFLKYFWGLLSRAGRESMARRLIDHLLQHDREEWSEMPGWRRADVPVLLEYEYFVPGPAAPDPGQN